MGYAHGKKWTEEIIISEISNIIKKFNMDTFPTHKEIKDYMGNSKLTCAISKHGGTNYFAEKMGINTKDCESKFGEKYELLTIEKISELGFVCKKTNPRFPYDILVENNIKIDVKVSKQILTNCNTWQNSFNLEKKEPTCDIFIMYCLDKDENYIKTVVIPSCILSGQTQVGIGNISKYNKYIDKWDIINKYYQFYNNMRNIYE